MARRKKVSCDSKDKLPVKVVYLNLYIYFIRPTAPIIHHLLFVSLAGTFINVSVLQRQTS
jgi:hypothetical protein